MEQEKPVAATFDVIKEVYTLFSRADKKLPPKNVGAALRSVGHNITQAELNDIQNQVDNNAIDFDKFLDFASKPINITGEKENLEEAFKTFAPNDGNLISTVELKHVLTNLGEKLSDEEATQLVHYYDAIYSFLGFVFFIIYFL